MYSTVSLAANSSLLGTYYFAGDDYFQFDKSIADWFATRGIWRIVGIPLPGWLVARDVYAFTLIAAHAIGGYFFFLVARRGFDSVAYALFLTIIVMAFPWGYEALYWASAAAYVFASCLLWVILWVLLSLRADQRQIYVRAAGLLFASFLCLLIHEAVFFSLCVAGFVVWMKPDFRRDWKSAAAVSLAPLLGALLWGVIYELIKPAEPVLLAARAPPVYHYADGNHECCGSNMADLGTATDPHILAPWQLSRDKCDLHFRLLDELIGGVDLPNGNETGLPAR